MNRFWKGMLGAGLGLLLGMAPAQAEEWKGTPPEGAFSFGLLGGIAPLNSLGGVPLVGHIAAKIVPLGFIPDINNQVWIEAAAGVHIAFLGAFTSGLFSTHLRWDFVLSDEWTFFAVGGFGGAVVSTSAGSSFTFHPRFGVGSIYYFVPQFGIRFELSHEWTAVGLQVRLP
jgi:hypothetical protein